MKAQRILLTSIAVLAFALATVAGGAPATAQSPSPAGNQETAAQVLPAGLEDCKSGYFCAWVNINFDDGPGQWDGRAPDYTFWPHRSCGLTWNDCASSVYNNGQNCNLTFYEHANYRGAYYNLARGGRLADMRLDRMSDGNHANDRVSSHQWCTF